MKEKPNYLLITSYDVRSLGKTILEFASSHHVGDGFLQVFQFPCTVERHAVSLSGDTEITLCECVCFCILQ